MLTSLCIYMANTIIFSFFFLYDLCYNGLLTDFHETCFLYFSAALFLQSEISFLHITYNLLLINLSAFTSASTSFISGYVYSFLLKLFFYVSHYLQLSFRCNLCAWYLNYIPASINLSLWSTDHPNWIFMIRIYYSFHTCDANTSNTLDANTIV